MARNKYGLIILIILALSLFFRIYDLGNESIWGDEAGSIRVANSGPSQIIQEPSRDTILPFYFIILHYWIDLFGDSEFSARFLSVVFGFLAIFMVYKVGSLIFDKDVGVLSSLLLGFSVFHIRYSQEIRTYSLMALLTLLSMYFFIRLLKQEKLMICVAYILSSALLIYTHVFGLFIIIAQNIYFFTLFLLSKKAFKFNLKRWLLLQFILVALVMPGIMILIKQALWVQEGFWIPVPSLNSIIGSFSKYAGSSSLLLFFIILSFFSIVSYKKIKDGIYLLLVWLLTPIILPFVISRFSAPIYWPVYTIGASIAFYLLVAKGIKNINYRRVKSVIISIVITFSLINIWRYYSEVNKPQWREAVNYIDTNAATGDLLLFRNIDERFVHNYYSKRIDLIKTIFRQEGKAIDEESIKELGPLVKGFDRIWFTLTFDRNYESLFKKMRNESYNVSRYKKYAKIEVYLFEKN